MLNEIKLGPITLFYELEPPIPSVKEQAHIVAEFLYALDDHTRYEGNARENILKLQKGDLGAIFKQYTPEEVEDIKRKLVHYDEIALSRTLFPLEDQLWDFFLNIRAQQWGTEHGHTLTWEEWDRYRKHIEIEQVSLTKVDLKNLDAQKRMSAMTRARQLASHVVTTANRSESEISSLAHTLLKEMFLSNRITYPLHTNMPVQLPSRIPNWAWNEGLYLRVEGWWELMPEVFTDLPANLMAVPSAKPMMMADRAFRTPNVWSYADGLPFYAEKKNPGITLQYIKENSTPEDIREMLTTLDPRTSDVWHLLLAKALENGRSQLYQSFEIDVRDLARALGYTPHHKGGMKPRDIEEVGKALDHISNTWIKITPAETTTLERDQGQAKRKKQQIVDSTEQRLLTIWERRVSRDLFGTTRHLVWEVALGKWAQLFPASYAPIFRGLVDLPAKGKSLWAKQIGKELAFWYRQDRSVEQSNPGKRRRTKVIRVETLLERACLLPEINKMRQQGSRKRVREYFDAAMDLLQELGVHEGWNYNSEQASALDAKANKPGAFELWLHTNVELQAPQSLLDILPAVQASKPKGRKPKKLLA